MNKETDLRKLYRPLQPLLLPASQVAYQEVCPCEPVSRYIYCYWRLRTQSPLTENFQYRIVADGCIDIFFELNNPSENFVMGLCNKYTEFSIGHTFDYVGIRFFPSAFPVLFRTDASDLTDRFEHLANVAPDTSKFIENQFSHKNTTTEISTILDSYFSRLISGLSIQQDCRFYAALEIIMSTNGAVNIETQLDTGLSSRQLRRLFDRYIGDSPKTFSKIIRFQNALEQKVNESTDRNQSIPTEDHYYDQAHFIKEFKHFSGLTPSVI
ncbi:AraC family transcriptional regulator [Dyadobacter luteus]|uniref:AraC family transcriptional regulator n=1 Tax=Dyadobacter luteus TaxID=2259619 RepID=A0A3D8YGG7_9BACT|nr:helix-turn-helix domain-containing protein [Dyadobacter luteus]REA63775.1 AraC family transcriptional regulator [Dyadobacter luteus]